MLRPKIGLTYAISIVKWIFGIYVSENVFSFLFLLFIAEFQLYMFHNNIVKISEKLSNRKNLPPSYLPYLFLHNLHSFLLGEKWRKKND